MTDKEKLQYSSESSLSESNLAEVLTKIKSQEDKAELLSIKPTKLMISGAIAEYLAERGYDTQGKIDELITDLLANNHIA